MAAIFGEHGYQLMPNLFGKLLQLIQCQFLDMNRTVHHFEISAHNRNCSDDVLDGRCQESIGRQAPLLRLFVNRQRLQFHLACRIFFQLLNLQLRFGQLILTNLGQVRAFRVLT